MAQNLLGGGDGRKKRAASKVAVTSNGKYQEAIQHLRDEREKIDAAIAALEELEG
jgi:hypothetical protein